MAGRTARLLVACALLQLAGLAAGRFVIEQGGLRIVLPEDASKKYSDGFETSLGNFGSSVYGGELVGKLVYPDPDYGYGADIKCNPPCNFACQPFNESEPVFDLTKQKDETYILLADRGPNNIAGVNPCKFAEKAWNAQQAGAKGIIVMNYEDKHTTMYAPEDDEESYKWLKNISIPAVFVTQSTGDALKELLKDGKEVIVSLDWNDVLPRQKTVEWEFWTNSNDMCGAVCDVQAEFIKEFVPIAKDLEMHNWTHFTPHYKVWRCPDTYRDSEECQKQCIRSGRYCSPDPESDDYDGKEIVQENLRQLCVFKLANESGQPWLWWDYVTAFNERCKMKDNNYGRECAEKVFTDEIDGGKWSSIDTLRECVGEPDDDKENALLEAEYDSQVGDEEVGEVYILPTIRINHVQYRGKLAYYEVVRALCTGFNKDFEPDECLKVSENECISGGPGDAECKANKNGKTRCMNTFTDYECICGDGFYPHKNEAGEEECLDVNECWSAGTTLGHNCTCERCACRNTWGDYECLTDLPDNCVEEKGFGNCWHAQYKVHGSQRTFTACKDNLPAYKAAAANGDDVSNFPLHTCECPPCFVEDGGGCKPKCSLDHCDLDAGVCTEISGGGFSGWMLALVVVVAALAVAAGGYFIYWFRLRSAMHQEIRAIMAQYMPLEAQGAAGNGNVPAGPPAASASGGLATTELMSKTPNGL